MLRFYPAALAGGLLFSACTTAPAPQTVAMPAPSAEPAPRPEVGGALPANSELVLRLDENLSSEESRVGDVFTAVVDEEVSATSGEIILPAGTVVTGMVTGVDGSDAPGDPAAVRLNFLRIRVDGVTHPFTADIVATHLRMDREAERGDVATGAVLGAVIGGDLRDALLGGALGAGAGTIISLGSGERDAVLPAGTRLVVRTRDRLELR